MLLKVNGLKTYDGFYVEAKMESKNGTEESLSFGPFSENDNILFDKFLRLINQSCVTQQPLIHCGEFKDWFDCKSTVKGFVDLAKRINVAGKYTESDIRRTSTVLKYNIYYRTGNEILSVNVEDINQPSLFFKYD